MPVGAIVGISVLAAIILILVLGFALVYFRRRRKEQRALYHKLGTSGSHESPQNAPESLPIQPWSPNAARYNPGRKYRPDLAIATNQPPSSWESADRKQRSPFESGYQVVAPLTPPGAFPAVAQRPFSYIEEHPLNVLSPTMEDFNPYYKLAPLVPVRRPPAVTSTSTSGVSPPQYGQY